MPSDDERGPEGPPASPGEPRRVLGDAWSDWDSSRAGAEADTHAGPALFCMCATVVAVSAATGAILILWLAEPRLQALGLSGAGVRLLGAALLGLTLLPALLLWGAVARVPYPSFLAALLLQGTVRVWGPVLFVARLLRCSRDRVAHAFIQVTNHLGLLAHPRGRGDELLVLAPRCLRPEILRGLREIARDAGAQFAVVGGGGQALAAVAESHSRAVLAVACERDLVAGIRDVVPRRTVLGLANRRPEGPCRNSEIDLGEARRMLALLRGQ